MVVRAGPVLLISSIAHAALVALVADWMASPAERPLVLEVAMAPPPAPASTPTGAPIEVAFVELEPDTMPASPVTGAISRTGPRIRAHTTAAPTETSSAATTPSADGNVPGGPGSGLMRMRGADLALGDEIAQRIASAPQAPGAPRDEPRVSGKLESQPGGRAVVHDRVATLTVDADGKAHFDDKKDIDLKFKLPVPKFWRVREFGQDLGDELSEWFKDPEAGKRYGRTQDLPRHLQASEGACDSWANVMCDDPLAPRIDRIARERKAVNGGFLGGAADITAWLHRKFVGDPYASRKLKLLDDTRDERVAMGSAYRAQQSVRSAEYMTKNLEALWARELPAVARRAALFELWDECGEDDAGTRARAVVIGWIRARLPAGSAAAFTDEELELLQTRRTSSVPFAPYAE